MSTSQFEVKQVSDYVYDIFRGNGWENWSRFRREGNQLILVGGASVTKEEYRKLHELL